MRRKAESQGPEGREEGRKAPREEERTKTGKRRREAEAASPIHKARGGGVRTRSRSPVDEAAGTAAPSGQSPGFP